MIHIFTYSISRIENKYAVLNILHPMRRVEGVRDELMSCGYVFDTTRSKEDLRCTNGTDYWVDCQHDGRDIRFKWQTAIYPGAPHREEVVTFEVLNLAGTRPMLDDDNEIFELNRMRNYESLDMLGTECTNLQMAIRMSRLQKVYE